MFPTVVKMLFCKIVESAWNIWITWFVLPSFGKACVYDVFVCAVGGGSRDDCWLMMQMMTLMMMMMIMMMLRACVRVHARARTCVNVFVWRPFDSSWMSGWRCLGGWGRGLIEIALRSGGLRSHTRWQVVRTQSVVVVILLCTVDSELVCCLLFVLCWISELYQAASTTLKMTTHALSNVVNALLPFVQRPFLVCATCAWPPLSLESSRNYGWCLVVEYLQSHPEDLPIHQNFQQCNAKKVPKSLVFGSVYGFVVCFMKYV